jgi:hypothetical protein
MSTYAFVVEASSLSHRLMAANLILSSKSFGNYTWYAILDKPLGIGERFIQMPEGEQGVWRSQNNPRKFYLKFADLEKALKVSSEEYLIHLDCDCVFHGPPNVAKLIDLGRRSFALLEGDLFRPDAHRLWGWPNEEIREWLGKMDYPHTRFFNLNGGFFGVRRDSWKEFITLIERGIGAAVRMNPMLSSGWMADEQFISYAVHMMNSEHNRLLADRNLDVFFYSGAYPERPLYYQNWGTSKDVPVPERLGIVHVFQKYDLLAADGRKRLVALGKNSQE